MITSNNIADAYLMQTEPNRTNSAFFSSFSKEWLYHTNRSLYLQGEYNTKDAAKSHPMLYPNHFTFTKDQTRVFRMQSHYANHCVTNFVFCKNNKNIRKDHFWIWHYYFSCIILPSLAEIATTDNKCMHYGWQWTGTEHQLKKIAVRNATCAI